MRLNSKQRFLNAIRCQPVDHLPLYFRLWSLGGNEDNVPFDWRDQIRRCEALLALGLDDTLLLEPPLGETQSFSADLVPGVGVRVAHFEADGVEPYPRLEKTYFTAAGKLYVKIKISQDWPHGEDIPFFSDFNIPRYLKPPVTSAADLPALRCVLAEASPVQIAEFHLRAEEICFQANRLQVGLDAGWTSLGDSAAWLCGMEAVLTWQMDNPGLLAGVLDALLEWELRRVDLLLNEGVDELVHRAWYEGTDFWSLRNFRLLLKPRLKQLVSKAHSAGIPFRYIITRGWWPIREDLIEIGVDCICGVDPVQDRLVLADVAGELAGKVGLMGGMNAAVTLSQWDEPRIRQAVAEAMGAFSSANGFILYPVDCISTDLPWDRSLLVIDEWKNLIGKGGNYKEVH